MYASEQGTLNAQWNAAAQQENNAYEQSKNILLERQLLVIKNLSPQFGKDGNQYFYMLGELPEADCIVGFGDTPAMAMQEFCKAFGI